MTHKRLIGHITLAIIIFYTAITALHWLMIIGLLGWMIFFVATSRNRWCVAFRQTTWLSYPALLLLVFIAAIGFKSMFMCLYKIPSSSMEQTIKPGDIVWVNKMVYGPRLPASPYDIPWVNVLFWLTNRHDSTKTQITWPYRRLKGFSQMKVGDIFVFEHPDLGENFIKRCMGAPGDTLQLIDARVFINHKPVANPPRAQFYSRIEMDTTVRTPNPSLTKMLKKEWMNFQPHQHCYAGIMLTENQRDQLRQHPQVSRVSFETRSADTIWLVYPFIRELNWDIDNYGPIVIPCKGLRMKLDDVTFALYQSIIRKYEGHDFYTKDNLYYLDGQPITHYEFSHDYCFAMGDNRHDSNDSRYFGFVPMKLVVGKATATVYSPDSDGIQ